MTEDIKRYQVFISSTYTDLKTERQEVVLRLLEADAFPAGMELFPATNEGAWPLIERVIEESDYYLLIIGGRYGTMPDDEDLSFTEKEYDYAKRAGKPIMAFLHGAPETLAAKDVERSEAGQEFLKKFREKVQKYHHVKYWTSAEQLGGQVAVAFNQFARRWPAIGWMRADAVSHETLQRVAELQARVEELTTQIQRAADNPPPGTENLASGSDPTEILVEITFKYLPADWNIARCYELLPTTWDEIFSAVCPKLLDEAEEETIREVLSNLLGETHFEIVKTAAVERCQELGGEESKIHGLKATVDSDDFGTVIVQLLALGLIQKSDKRRSVASTGTYWTLTPYGEKKAVQLRAARRPSQTGSDTHGSRIQGGAALQPGD